MAKKTVQITVNFFVDVPAKLVTENLCIDVKPEDIRILDGVSPVPALKVHEYETIMAEEI